MTAFIYGIMIGLLIGVVISLLGVLHFEKEVDKIRLEIKNMEVRMNNILRKLV